MMALKPLMELSIEMGPAQVTPDGPYGTRRFIPVTGGTFTGERLKGRILPGGADCQLIRPDGVAELDARITLQLEDGVNVLMRGVGLRHGATDVMRRIASGEAVPASAYYFRQSMLFEAPGPDWGWLNRMLALGVGERRPDGVRLAIFEIT
jgi:hypothetical protein